MNCRLPFEGKSQGPEGQRVLASGEGLSGHGWWLPWLCQQDGGRSLTRGRPSEREDAVATAAGSGPVDRALQNGGWMPSP